MNNINIDRINEKLSELFHLKNDEIRDNIIICCKEEDDEINNNYIYIDKEKQEQILVEKGELINFISIGFTEKKRRLNISFIGSITVKKYKEIIVNGYKRKQKLEISRSFLSKEIIIRKPNIFYFKKDWEVDLDELKEINLNNDFIIKNDEEKTNNLFDINLITKFMSARFELLKIISDLDFQKRLKENSFNPDLQFQEIINQYTLRYNFKIIDFYSFFYLFKYIFFTLDILEFKLWYINQEVKLIKFRLNSSYSNKELGIINLLNEIFTGEFHVIRFTDLRRSTSKSIGIYFINDFPYCDLPKFLIAFPILNEFVEEFSNAHISQGFIYYSYKQIETIFIPLYLKKLYSKLLDVDYEELDLYNLNKDFKDLTKNSNNSNNYNNTETKLNNNFTLKIDRLILNEIKNLKEKLIYYFENLILSNKRQLNFYNTNNINNIIDIEDLGKVGTNIPPCLRNLNQRLTKDPKHLHFHERKQYAAMLLDLGYEKEVVYDHLRTHFMSSGKIDLTLFNSKYSKCLERDKKGHSYGLNCENLYGNLENESDNQQFGCPFKFRNEDQLKQLIISSGIDEENHQLIDQIIQISKNEKSDDEHKYKTACEFLFSSLYGQNALQCNGSYRNPMGYYFKSKSVYKQNK